MDFDNSIWNLIINLEDDKYNFKNNGFKEDYEISQLIAPLKIVIFLHLRLKDTGIVIIAY